MSRPQKTLADYAVIGISPALIMLLLGSFVYFLLIVFDRGGFAGRVQYVITLFIFAAVLIGRISIEEGRERAALFAVPLGIAVLMAVFRFRSGPDAAHTPAVYIAVIAAIWFLADKLTWDCTVIDERADASGEGLLQTAGLDRERRRQSSSASDDLQATTGGQPAAPEKSWWQRFVANRKRPHAPGVWVIYFSLIALPIFGIGQRFVSAADIPMRRYVFQLLLVFVATALGLLMTSSFLGIRRYLRQRRLEMPAEMAGVWLGVGSLMIAILLGLCALLPRPHPEYSVTQLSWQIDTTDQPRANRGGWGSEGAGDPKRRARNRGSGDREQATRSGDPGDQESSASRSGQGKSKANGRSGSEGKRGDRQGTSESSSESKSRGQDGKAGGSPSSGGDAPESAADSRRSESGRNGKSDESSGSRQGQDAASGESRESREGAAEKPSDPPRGAGGESRGERQAPSEKRSERRGSANPRESSSAGEASAETAEQAPAEPDSARPETSRPSTFRPLEWINRLLGGLPHVFQWLYRLIFIILAAYLVWRYWERVRDALRDFLESLRKLWESLFGSRSQADEEQAAEELVPRPKPFGRFANPFARSAPNRAPADLVTYSFRALEAWGFEQGCPRDEEQTPHEFAMRLRAAAAVLGDQPQYLAELYCRVAYSEQPVTPRQAERLRRLWQLMETNSAAEDSRSGRLGEEVTP